MKRRLWCRRQLPTGPRHLQLTPPGQRLPVREVSTDSDAIAASHSRS
jgi:hypothetical protein